MRDLELLKKAAVDNEGVCVCMCVCVCVCACVFMCVCVCDLELCKKVAVDNDYFFLVFGWVGTD